MGKAIAVIVTWTFFGLLAGLLSSCTLGAASITGKGDVAWANWQPLGAPPEKPVRIVGIGSPVNGIAIVVDTADKRYACCAGGPGHWTEQARDSVLSGLDYNAAPGSYVVNTPADVVATAGARSCAELCSFERHYVIRADGSVWTWGTSAAGPQDPPGIFLSQIAWLLWTVAGLGVGLAVSGLGRMAQRPAPPAHPAPSA